MASVSRIPRALGPWDVGTCCLAVRWLVPASLATAGVHHLRVSSCVAEAFAPRTLAFQKCIGVLKWMSTQVAATDSSAPFLDSENKLQYYVMWQRTRSPCVPIFSQYQLIEDIDHFSQCQLIEDIDHNLWSCPAVYSSLLNETQITFLYCPF